ncbi:hypothetical protein DPMN_127443 [Dreissena polymorpha]|uniref:Uncharacterized protein n=1 Tax=Dreissena polymorpha TaxID=45954 RepID=A0A9D4GYY6_DREPO|nr:hypothetical protein DPMN_127443 [Dreissena polymorpha]
MPSTNTDKLKGQRLGNQKVIDRFIERLEENDKLQFEPTIVAIENQLEIIRGLKGNIIRRGIDPRQVFGLADVRF